MPPVELFVVIIEAAAKYGPGLIEAGANLLAAIEGHTELTPEQKADLTARVKAAASRVSAVEPRVV